MRSDNLGLVNFAIGLVNSVLNLPGGQVNFLWGGGGGGRMGERMEKARPPEENEPLFHFVVRAIRKSSRLHGKGSIFFVSDLKILTSESNP